jgi:hypothetical protein
MIAVHLIAGDANGGPYAQAVLDLDRDAESLTDAEIAEWREAVKTIYREGFNKEPEQVIVYVDE